MPREQTIRVYANPYCVLDHEGRPAGAVMFDPVDHHGYASSTEPRRYVGAELDTEKTVVYQKAAKGSAQADLQDTVWKFSADAVTLPLSHYYLGHVRSGELIAADEETAEHAGVAFVSRDEALEAAKTKTLATLKAERPKRALPELADAFAPAPVEEPADLDDVIRATAGEDGIQRADGVATNDGTKVVETPLASGSLKATTASRDVLLGIPATETKTHSDEVT